MKPLVKWSAMCCLASSLFLSTPSAWAANPDLPSLGLESRTEFWKKVFTTYGAADIILHDGYYVNLIYDVAADADVETKEKSVHAALAEMRTQWNTPDAWSPESQRIYRNIDAVITETGMTTSLEILAKLDDNVNRQRGIKERFRDGVIRSGRYIDNFRQTFKNAGLPEELALLPMVESSYVNARSKVGAVGVWQFMADTGRQYLKIDNAVDERLDPFKSAEAAAKLLAANYRALGVWPLAITAYNHGQGGMLRAQKQHGNDIVAVIQNYQSPIFGYASMNFYAELLAVVEVYASYPEYFGQLVLDPPEKPGAPAVRAATAVASNAPAARPKPAAAAAAEKYKVRNGDTLWEIAQKFGTSIRTLMEKNKLDKPLIYAGQMLMVR